MAAMFRGHWKLEGEPPSVVSWDLQQQEVAGGLPVLERCLALGLEGRHHGDTNRPQLEI